jgi:hypothetical protein
VCFVCLQCHATLSYNIPWLGGEDYKRKLLDFKNMAAFLAFTRDRDCGRVSIDSRGEALVHYRLSKRDGKTMLQVMPPLQSELSPIECFIANSL